ncbi:L,D-transpeptidase family protein [Kineosporia rhizophila]|uniref:L,D-transpeptidase family protein n=1 Tax=Kineosporia rhizophila TaxID=84633 RepID=UPI001E3CC285|nr:L,D-transpeptidase family protein [Kineosporia rhizophila]
MKSKNVARRAVARLLGAAVLSAALIGVAPAGAQAATPTQAALSTQALQTSSVVAVAQPTLKRGDSGPAVRTLQKKLNALGYWTGGTADGQFGGNTEQAVLALKKVARLPRDGIAGPKVWRALADGVRPKARSSRGHVIEVDKKRQVLKIVDDGRVRFTLNTSTGSGQQYSSQGTTRVASTPSGRYRVYRQIDGVRHAPLGVLYRPKYFNGGIAVHGADSVPAYPASHGCVRVSNAAVDWIWNTGKMPIGTRVRVY